MQWAERLIEFWCFMCNGWKDWLRSDVYMHVVERLIELWCSICTGRKDWLNSDVLYALGWLNSDVLYAWGGKIDWTLMFCMHGVERFIELCFICMGWKDWLNSDVSYARGWLNSDVLYARGGKINWILMFYIYAGGGKIDWTLMFYVHGVERLIELWCFICKRFFEVFCNFITIYEKRFLKFFKRM